MNEVKIPYEYVPQVEKGKPIAGGKLYIGLPDLDPTIPANQLSVSARQENGSEVAITQPVGLSAGGVPVYNGSPVTLLISESVYSIRAESALGSQVFEQAKSSALTPSEGSELTFDTVSDMQASGITIGQLVKTKGYYAVGDGGGATYLVAGAQAVDGFGDHELANGNVVLLQELDSINIKKYGATGDGVTDDYEAMQAAIDRVSSLKAPLEFPSGVYSSSAQLRAKSDSSWLLDDAAEIRRDFNTSATGAGLVGMVGGVSNFSIIGGTLNGNGASFPQSFNIFGGATCSDILLDGVTFLDVVDFHAVDVAAAIRVTVRNCKFLGFYNLSGTREFSEAIQLDPDLAGGGSDNELIVVEGNTFDANTGNFTNWPVAMGNHAASDGNFSKKVKFLKNDVIGASYAAVRCLNSSDYIISNNNFRACFRGVRIDFNLGGSGPEACNNLLISDNLFSEMIGESVTNGTIGFTTGIGNAKHTGVNISGNTIRGSGTAEAFDLAWFQNTNVSDNNVRAVDRGIHIRFCSQLVVANNQFVSVDENSVLINEGTETDFTGQGLTNDIIIVGNHFNDIGFRGVHLNCAAERVKITNNLIVDPDAAAAGREGIKVDSNPDKVSINGNSVMFTGSATSDAGIEVSTGTEISLYGNDSDGVGDSYRCSATGAFIDIADTGNPNGVFSARVGSLYRRLDGAAGAALYVKDSGTGNTGWTGL